MVTMSIINWCIDCRESDGVAPENLQKKSTTPKYGVLDSGFKTAGE